MGGCLVELRPTEEEGSGYSSAVEAAKRAAYLRGLVDRWGVEAVREVVSRFKRGQGATEVATVLQLPRWRVQEARGRLGREERRYRVPKGVADLAGVPAARRVVVPFRR